MAEPTRSTVRKGRVYHVTVADVAYRAFIWQAGSGFCGRVEEQPQIALWNLVQLANALHPLIEDVPPLEAALETYRSAYADAWSTGMAAKLGLATLAGEADEALLDELLALLALVETDMTLFFRALAESASKVLGQPVIIENKPGAGGTLAPIAAKNQNVATEAQAAVLKKQLDAEQQAAAQLLAMMGKGANLNVVG